MALFQLLLAVIAKPFLKTLQLPIDSLQFQLPFIAQTCKEHSQLCKIEELVASGQCCDSDIFQS